jgi:hypothetical protein
MACAPRHDVQIYEQPDELAGSVTAYLSAGFEANAAAIVIATAEHWPLFREGLQSQGHPTEALQASGELVVLDAETTLERLMDGDAPSAAAFEEVIGGMLDDTAARFPEREIRAFGEMVDVLWKRGQRDAALALEDLWNDLGRRRPFALLCGYQLDVFDPAIQRTALPSICGAHTAVLPTSDPERLDQAVGVALEEVLGRDQSGKVYLLAAADGNRHGIPDSQRALMWASANAPRLSERILRNARWHYRAAG